MLALESVEKPVRGHSSKPKLLQEVAHIIGHLTTLGHQRHTRSDAMDRHVAWRLARDLYVSWTATQLHLAALSTYASPAPWVLTPQGSTSEGTRCRREPPAASRQQPLAGRRAPSGPVVPGPGRSPPQASAARLAAAHCDATPAHSTHEAREEASAAGGARPRIRPSEGTFLQGLQGGSSLASDHPARPAGPPNGSRPWLFDVSGSLDLTRTPPVS